MSTLFRYPLGCASVLVSSLLIASPVLLAQDGAAQIEVDEAGVMTDPAAAGNGVRYGSFGISAGTGGYGIDFAYPLHEYFDVRVGYDFGKFSFDFEEDADDENADPIEYQADLKFSSARLLIDYKPFGGGFRISAGFYTGTPELEGRSDDRQNGVELGDGVFNIDGRVRADADIGSGAPYLGIGWGGTAGARGFGFSFDLGVLFADSPSFDIAVSGMACDASEDISCDPQAGFDAGTDPAFQAEVEAERRELEDDSKDFDMWPILRTGIHYRF